MTGFAFIVKDFRSCVNLKFGKEKNMYEKYVVSKLNLHFLIGKIKENCSFIGQTKQMGLFNTDGGENSAKA